MNNFQQACSPQDRGSSNHGFLDRIDLELAEYLRKVLDFLSLVNFRSIQLENIGKWTPGTIKWLLEGSLFQWWLVTQCSILWGTGMRKRSHSVSFLNHILTLTVAGAGKTILACVAAFNSPFRRTSDLRLGLSSLTTWRT